LAFGRIPTSLVQATNVGHTAVTVRLIPNIKLDLFFTGRVKRKQRGNAGTNRIVDGRSHEPAPRSNGFPQLCRFFLTRRPPWIIASNVNSKTGALMRIPALGSSNSPCYRLRLLPRGFPMFRL
jgi:hypothetical protein